MERKCVFLAAVALFLCVFGQSVFAQTTEFTYQGRLLDNGAPPTAVYDFEFLLFDAATDGTQLSSAITAAGVPVRNGIFSVVLDFGGVFDGNARFLEIHVRPSGGGAFTALAPRQPVTSAPYGIRALTANNADTAATATTAITATTATTAANAENLGGIPADQYIAEGDVRLIDTRDPNAGSSFYVQNQSAGTQPSTNFNISGTGTANIFTAGTQFNIGGNRVLSTPGAQNVFVGSASGFVNTKGSNNAFIGDSAGRFNTNGSRNTFAGYAAGFNTTEGGDNSFFGNYSGFTNITGTGNSALGFNADVNSNNLSFATAIGSGSRVSASNQIQLGRNGQDTVSVGKLADPSDTQVCINGTVLASCTPDHFVTTDDPRLSDERAPTEGSEYYIQNQNAAPQTGNFNIAGNGVVGGTLAVGSSDNKFSLPAVTGRSYGGQGVSGESTQGEGVFARSRSNTALHAVSDLATAIVAESTNGGTAVDVQSPMGQGMVIRSLLTGIDVESDSGTGIVVRSSQNGTTGIDVDTQGTGVVAKGLVTGVKAEGIQYGVSAKGINTGVRGEGSTFGVYGDSDIYGVYGSGTTAAGVYGSSNNFGVWGESDNIGVTGTGANVGVKGQGGTYGLVGSGTIGILAESTDPGNIAGRFTGDVQITGIVTNLSDKRLKKNIHTLGYGLKDVMRLRPVTWLWKDRPDGGTQLGFIAQEVETVMPELVSTIKNTQAQFKKMKGLNYIGFVPVIISSVQEQQEEIAELKAKNAELESKNAELEERLAAIEMALENLSKETEN